MAAWGHAVTMCASGAPSSAPSSAESGHLPRSFPRSMTFELPHFAMELLVILPCVQVGGGGANSVSNSVGHFQDKGDG